LGNGWWWAVGIVVFLIWISSNDGSNKSVVPAGSSTSPAPSTERAGETSGSANWEIMFKAKAELLCEWIAAKHVQNNVPRPLICDSPSAVSPDAAYDEVKSYWEMWASQDSSLANMAEQRFASDWDNRADAIKAGAPFPHLVDETLPTPRSAITASPKAPPPPGFTLDAAPGTPPPPPPGFTLDKPTGATEKPAARWYEEKPSPGVEQVLSYPQLRYCVAEDIRINAMKAMINEYESVEVAGFNRYVSDFNSRCVSFKYRNGSLESVQTSAAARRMSIEEEGRQRVLSWRSQGLVPQSPPVPAAVVGFRRPARSETNAAAVRQAQEADSGARGEGSVTTLSTDERASLEAACSSDKYLNGPAAYKDCVAKQMNDLERAPRNPDLSGLTADERASTEAACSSDKYLNGPAAYNRCIAVQVSSLSPTRQTVDLSWLSKDERASLDAACSSDKFLNGPAALNSCIVRQVAALRSAPRNIDVSGLSSASRSAVEAACSSDKYLNGPAAYDRCRFQQVSATQR